MHTSVRGEVRKSLNLCDIIHEFDQLLKQFNLFFCFCFIGVAILVDEEEEEEEESELESIQEKAARVLTR